MKKEFDIRKLRKAKNLSREDLAYQVGVSVQTIFRWETKRATPHKTFQKQLINILGQ